MLSSLSWLRGQLWNTFLFPTFSSFWRVLKLDVVGSFLANTGPISRSLNGLGYSQPSQQSPQSPGSQEPPASPEPPEWPWHVFPTSGFEVVPDSEILEEEIFEHFAAGDYYPVQIGDVYKDGRYQVVGKLGFGASSTAWLAADRFDNHYVILKVFARVEADMWEAAVAEYILNGKERFGRNHIRMVWDEFALPREGGDHYCLVQEPLGTSLGDFRSIYDDGRLAEGLVQCGMDQMLRGLIYLHSECFLIHTDLKADHVMQLLSGPHEFTEFVNAELENPSPRKFVDGKPVYRSRWFGNTKKWGKAKLCDFGNVIPGKEPVRKMAQLDFYRAPEILLRGSWGYPIDIWNLATLAWHLIQGEPLFHGRELDLETDEVFYTDRCHLAEIIEVLGLPPAKVLVDTTDQCFDEEGNFTFQGEDIQRFVGRTTIPEGNYVEFFEGRPLGKRDLSEELTALEGESKELFLDFMNKALTWDPAERMTAKETLLHPWIRAVDEKGYYHSNEPMPIDW